jgi:hypothetical protein
MNFLFAVKLIFVILPSMTNHRVYNKSNATGVTCGAGTVYPSREPEFTPGFSEVRVTRSLVSFLCSVLYILFGHFHLAIELKMSNNQIGIVCIPQTSRASLPVTYHHFAFYISTRLGLCGPQTPYLNFVHPL